MTRAAALPSYSCGPSAAPLLGDTIGANLDRTVAAHRHREALVDCATGRRWTYDVGLQGAMPDAAQGAMPDRTLGRW